MKVSHHLKKFVRGKIQNLQKTGSCLAVILPKPVLETFDLSQENRAIVLSIQKDGILICPKQQ